MGLGRSRWSRVRGVVGVRMWCSLAVGVWCEDAWLVVALVAFTLLVV